jgi:Ca2+-binding RTX toxin-like protein
MGNDDIYGDDGADTIYGDSQMTSDVSNSGTDRLYGGSGNDTIYGDCEGPGAGYIMATDYIYGGSDNDTLYGDCASCNITDYFGTDGYHASDTIEGNGGADILYGDCASNCSAEMASDTFVYTNISDSTSSSRDTIRDFSIGGIDDVIQLPSGVTHVTCAAGASNCIILSDTDGSGFEINVCNTVLGVTPSIGDANIIGETSRTGCAD